MAAAAQLSEGVEFLRTLVLQSSAVAPVVTWAEEQGLDPALVLGACGAAGVVGK